MKNKVVFLDRDGTINIDYGYVHKKSDFKFIEGTFEALNILQSMGFKLIIITNQSGIARNYFTEADFITVNDYMLQQFKLHGIEIAKVYYCPHLDGCECRKPQIKLFKDAKREFNIDMARSYAIGDKLRDLAICVEEPVTGILLSKDKDVQYQSRENLLDAAKLVLEMEKVMKNREIVKKRFEESIAVKEAVLKDDALIVEITKLAEEMIRTIRTGNKILICGNGGSASDAQHIVGEIVGRFQKERKGAAAISLNSDVATMTAIANDYGFDNVYARQVEGILNSGDLFMGITTSGTSKNIINATKKAKELGGMTACLTGKNGGDIKDIVDFSIVVPGQVTARIQESHILIGHILCELLENTL